MLELDIENSETLQKVAHALSSQVRIDILKLLNDKKLNINEISHVLKLPVSTIASNIRVLEEAGLIYTEVLPATRGTMKVCSRVFEDIYMKLHSSSKRSLKNTYQLEMPIGHYKDCEVSPTCGIITRKGLFLMVDEPSVFFHPDRMNAQLLWFRKGYLDYRLPLQLPPNAKIESIQFSMELCSEAPKYDDNWPSDITIWINEEEIITWTCPSDFGDRKGKLNPGWFPTQDHTQYGLLKTWKIDHKGSYLDDIKLSGITLNDLHIDKRKYVDFRIGIKSNAINIGGINLFGKELGDYEQDILMKIIYS